MGKITITGDTPAELQETLDLMFGAAESSAPVQGASAEAPKRTRTRKAAEAPPPVQPADPQQQKQQSPFTQAQQEQPQQAPFSPQPGPNFGMNGSHPAERPVVTKLKELLNTLSAAHGEPQVYAWCMQKGLGLPPTVSKDDFLNTVIYQQPDDKLMEVYKMGGGQ
jgi:hypothetical protein